MISLVLMNHNLEKKLGFLFLKSVIMKFFTAAYHKNPRS